MDHFHYIDGILHAEKVAIPNIAADIGTPFYVYSKATLTHHFYLMEKALEGMDHLICYAMKANSNLAVVKLLGQLGAGMDVVSGGEYSRAIAAGIDPQKIVFSGIGKTRAEMKQALMGGIRQFNVESEPELHRLSEVASALGKIAPVALRINPDIDAKTHDKISTGRKSDKFGIPFEQASAVYAQAAALPGLEIIGIDMHIGSQLEEFSPYTKAYRKMAMLVSALRTEGYNIQRLDIGGGLGIPYVRTAPSPPLPAEFGKIVRSELGHLGCEIEVEPGRVIAGNAGILVSEITYIKEGADRKFLILDAAMNDLLRPALYQAYHEIIPVEEARANTPVEPYDIVGPVCESSDKFATRHPLPAQHAGALVALRSAGAYGAVMASEYNSRPLIPEVLVDDERYAVIRPRPDIREMLGRDRIPEWL